MSEGNGLMTAEEWTTPDPRQYRVVEIDGRKIRIRSLHAGDISAYQAPNYRTDGKVNVDRAKDTILRKITVAVVNENNEPFLTFGHVSAMRNKDAGFIERLDDAIDELSGIKKESDVEKNSDPTPAGASQSS